METGAIVFGGIIVSLIVQYIKNKMGTATTGTMLWVVGLSLLGGLAYSVLVHFGYWQSVVGVLTAAGAFYAFVIKNTKSE